VTARSAGVGARRQRRRRRRHRRRSPGDRECGLPRHGNRVRDLPITLEKLIQDHDRADEAEPARLRELSGQPGFAESLEEESIILPIATVLAALTVPLAGRAASAEEDIARKTTAPVAAVRPTN
jgi:hypothetical protein